MRFALLFISVLCCSAILCRAQRLNTTYYDNSDFVIRGKLIRVDTLRLPIWGLGVSPFYFYPGKVNSDSLARADAHKFTKADSLAVNAQYTKDSLETAKWNHEARIKNRIDRKAMPPKQYNFFAYYTMDVLRFTYITREVYKDANHPQQAEMHRGDTVSFMFISRKLDNTTLKYLYDSRKMIAYFNEQYYHAIDPGDNKPYIPLAYRTAELDSFYRAHKMYWIDPKRLEKPDELSIQY